MKRKLFFASIACALALVGCSAKTESKVPEQTQENVQTEETVEETENTEVEDTEVSTVDSLADYLLNYPDSKMYHVLYDIALNEDADGSGEDGVSYMFITDDDGKRTIGSVMAYYTGIEVADTSSNESYCDGFIDAVFPELSSLKDMAQDTDAEDHWIRSYYFNDYVVSFIPNSDFDGMTLALAKVE